MSFTSLRRPLGRALFLAALALPLGLGGARAQGEPESAMRGPMTAERCAQIEAQATRHMDELEKNLNLTEAQKPLFAAFRQGRLTGARAAKASCTALIPQAGATRPSLPDREARMEQMLSQRLETLRANRPTTQALYDSLNPAQKSVIDAPPNRQGRMERRQGRQQSPAQPPAQPGPQ